MATECGKRRLKEQEVFHYEQIFRFDTDHAIARRALGYSRVDDRWIKTDEWMQSRGYVRHRGSWRIPQDVEMEKRVRERELAIKQLRSDIKMWRSWIIKGRDRQADGFAKFRELDDVAAVPALIELFESQSEHPRLKEMYIETLERLGTATAFSILAKQSIEDPESTVREKCLDAIERAKPHAATSIYLQALAHKDNRKVNRAAAGLERIHDVTTTLPLINSLTTKHKYILKTGRGGNLGASFGGSGAGGLNVGGGPKIIERDVTNSRVLDALVRMHPGTNFGYNKEAWKRWYADQSTPAQINLRRG